MRSKKKFILLVIFVVLLLSQTPFVYRRYKLRRLSAAIQQLNSQRTPTQPATFVEYKGVAHVHSFLGGHSSGTFAEIISAAQANQLQFVIMTEHAEKEFDTAAMTLKGMHGGVLFINGNEVSAENGERSLVLPDNTSFVAYPEESNSWDAARMQGVEIYNVFTNAKQINRVVAFFDALWSQRSYPDLIFAHYLRRPDENLKNWDKVLANTRIPAIAGNDAHNNIGVNLKDSAGKTLIGIQLDPYEVSFRLVRLHVLIHKSNAFDETNLLGALQVGHCFIGFDFLGDTSGFTFKAFNKDEWRIQGDEIRLTPLTRLWVESPVPSRIVVFKDGAVFADESGITSKGLGVTERGVYRVEVYLPQLGGIVAGKPWIISNPIFVR
jgi:hypothetical protein